MATDMHLGIIEEVIGYNFTDLNLLTLSLTAAGAEEDNHEGNRLLAQIGDAAIDLAVAVGGYEKEAAPNKVNDMRSFLSDTTFRAQVVEHLNIAACIKLSPRSRGNANKKIMNLALSAIIGAVYRDSDNLHVVARTIRRLNLLRTNQSVIDPMSLQTTEAVQSIPGSACKELIEEGWERPAPITKDKGKNRGGGKEVIMNNDIEMTGIEPTETHCSDSSAQTRSEQEIVPPPVHDDIEDPFFGTNIIDDNSDLGLLSNDFGSLDPVGAYDSASMRDVFGADTSEIDLMLGPAGQPLSSEHDRILVEVRQPGELQDMTVRREPEIPITRSKKSRNDRTIDDHLSLLHPYIEMETERCRTYGHEVPHDTFLARPNMNELIGCGNKIMSNLLNLYLAICSPETIVTLQGSLAAIRAGQNVGLPSPMASMTIEQRFAAIEGIGRQKAHLTLIERLHILKLYEDHCETATQDAGWIVVHEPQPLRKGNPGNPQNSAKASTTKALLKKIFPSLEEDAGDYRRKYGKVQNMRRLGQRLQLLKSRFGEGVVGLIQCDDLEVNRGFVNNISNRMLLAPNNKDFKQFVAVLQRTQGPMISRWSEAVQPLIGCIIRGDLCDAARFPLEHVEQRDILQLPRYSDELLRLINPY